VHVNVSLWNLYVLVVSERNTPYQITCFIDSYVVCGRVASIRLDCDPSVSHFADLDVGEAASINWMRSDDLQIILVVDWFDTRDTVPQPA